MPSLFSSAGGRLLSVGDVEEPITDTLRRPSSLRFWYGASISNFVAADPAAVFGDLTRSGEFALLPTQRDAWLSQIEFLQSQLQGFSGSIFFEFNIPRMGRRIDVVLVIGPVIFAIEFKVGEKDIRSFCNRSGVGLRTRPEEFSRGESRRFDRSDSDRDRGNGNVHRFTCHADPDKLYRPIVVDPQNFRSALEWRLAQSAAPRWMHRFGRERHIIRRRRSSKLHVLSTRSIRLKRSLVSTLARRIFTSPRDASRNSWTKLKRNDRKRICFVTGVPGAGKTLVGLNFATRREEDEPTHAVFLSGNGPLVAVLREALTRDEVARRKKQGEKVRKGKVGESVKAFIQNVHHFRDDALIDVGPPIEHVVIFDEAQRAWNLKQTASFMLRKKRRPGFSDSEPEFLISYMDRHKDWAVIVCLVGGGQEINTGEAGIDAWLDAVNRRFPEWEMFISKRLTDTEYAAGRVLEIVRERPRTEFDDSLHLAVSMRSFRAENVSAFVKALLDCEKEEAKKAFAELAERYPIAITRDLNVAKQWIRVACERNRALRFSRIVKSDAAQTSCNRHPRVG